MKIKDARRRLCMCVMGDKAGGGGNGAINEKHDRGFETSIGHERMRLVSAWTHPPARGTFSPRHPGQVLTSTPLCETRLNFWRWENINYEVTNNDAAAAVPPQSSYTPTLWTAADELSTRETLAHQALISSCSHGFRT